MTQLAASFLYYQECWNVLPAAQSGFLRTHEHNTVSKSFYTLLHVIMCLAELVEGVNLSEAGVNFAINNQLVVGRGLRIVAAVRTLQAFLADPMVAQIYGGIVASCTGTDHYHAPSFTDKYAGSNGGFTWVFENDLRIASFTQCFPESFAKSTAADQPFLLTFSIGPMRG